MATIRKKTTKKPVTIKQPPVLFSKTQEIIGKLSKLLNGPVISYWTNGKGSVCENDVVALNSLLGRLGHHDVFYLFIRSGGGNGQASLRLVNLLRQYCKQLVVLVPDECASAATMIALGAEKIVMGPMSYLTAVDTSLNHPLSPVDKNNERVSVSLNELTRVVKLWRSEQDSVAENPYKSLYSYIHPLVIGAVDRAESLSLMLCKDLLSMHMKDEVAAQNIATTLNSKYPSHGYPILPGEAKKIGLNIEAMSRELNDLLDDLNALYNEMGQRATTDFDENRSHSNEILNIHETSGIQVYYQEDKDWFYRTEERRWITMNDNNSWRVLERKGKTLAKSVLHIS